MAMARSRPWRPLDIDMERGVTVSIRSSPDLGKRTDAEQEINVL
jgi:hypothetical protein